jgi:phage terminase large subunit GpA-like protein
MSGRPPFANSPRVIADAIAARIAPRKPLKVSEWADAEARLSSKGSAEPGPWRTSRNPPLKEPMDCLSARSNAREIVLMFPIQFGKTAVALNALGYTMAHNPGPVMVCLPGEVARDKWIAQKLGPMLEETPAVKDTLTTVATRDGANRRDFKDFIGGQLYLEHAGSPQRLKSTSVRTLIVDELDEFAGNLSSGDDPLSLLEGRTSAFPTAYKRLYISTPSIQGISRIESKWRVSDQRRYHVPCPHCGHEQPLQWSGLQWTKDATEVWYVCGECGAVIDEHEKTDMIAAGRWVAENPGSKIRGYHINCLYYPLGLGPRWRDLVQLWREAQNDPARLKTFINDRLAEPWEDPAMRAVRHNVIADRAEPYTLRTAPAGVLAITAGVDTQDNRLAVQIVGWGRRMAAWTIDYIELPGDPAAEGVWIALTDLLNRGIQSAHGGVLAVQAVAIDAGGHRTEDVYHYVRSRKVRRPMAIMGAKANTAPVLSRGKYIDVTYRGRTDRRSLLLHHVGTVAVKHHLYSRLSADADLEMDKRLVRFSEELPPEYFAGLVSETYNPSRNRFEKKGGARNEPLDTWVYVHAAAHHPELRLHRLTQADWDAMERKLQSRTETEIPVDAIANEIDHQTRSRKKRRGFVGGWKP